MGDRLRDGRHRALIDDDRLAFVLAQTRLAPVPLVPEIRLHQADEATDLWKLTEAELGDSGLPPPFWAFAWAGGRGLARHVLDHPELARGRRIVDFASGSGLVAIAAALAGAADVVAVDIDPFAVAAIRLNAAASGVSVAPRLADIIGERPDADLLLAGDIFYDRRFAARVLPWLRELAGGGMTVLVGDPGRAYRPTAGVLRLGDYDVPVEAALEDAAVKRVEILEILRA